MPVFKNKLWDWIGVGKMRLTILYEIIFQIFHEKILRAWGRLYASMKMSWCKSYLFALKSPWFLYFCTFVLLYFACFCQYLWVKLFTDILSSCLGVSGPFTPSSSPGTWLFSVRGCCLEQMWRAHLGQQLYSHDSQGHWMKWKSTMASSVTQETWHPDVSVGSN